MRLDAGRLRPITVAIAAIATLLGLLAAPAAAAEPDDESAGTGTLMDQLDAASKAYLDAKAKLDASVKKQKELTERLASLEMELARRQEEVGILAATAYQFSGIGQLSSVLASDSPEQFLERVVLINAIGQHQTSIISDLIETRDTADAARAAIDAEVAEQEKQVAEMAKRKEQAERALRAAGGGQATGGPVGVSTFVAEPAPRNADGSWPSESCSEDDPTTGGCITPRTLHALQQARAAGFTRHTSCYRSGGSGEHPKGRACDFSATAGGFANSAATGSDRTYGNNLTAMLVNNANRLGVLYVIWYRQIWLPGSGWRSYSGSGSPAAEHTNHVHLSIY